MTFISSRTALFLAVALGLVVRVGVFWHTSSLGTEIVDEKHYVRLADNLLQGSGFAMEAGHPTSIRPPLFSALVAAIWSVTGPDNLQAIRIVQIALSLFTTALIYELGRRVFGKEVGRIAAAAFWLYPSLIFFNFTILTETLFTTLLVLFVLLTVVLFDRPRPAVALACGVSLGLAALTRSVLWPVPLVLCPMVALLVDGRLSRKVALSLLVFAGYSAVVAPWAVRNTKLQGVTTIVDTMGGMNLRMGNYEYTPDDRMWDAVAITGPHNWSYALGQERPGEVLTEGQKDKWAQEKAIAYMRANPATTARRSLIKFADFWGLEREFAAGVEQGLFAPPFWLATLASILIILAYVMIAVLGAAGIWLAAPDLRMHAALLLPVVAITGIHTLVFGHSRYHIPLIPILTVYAAALVCNARELRWQQYRPALVGALVTVFVLGCIWTRQIVFVDAERIRSLLAYVG